MVTKKVSYGHLHLQGIFTQMPRRQPARPGVAGFGSGISRRAPSPVCPRAPRNGRSHCAMTGFRQNFRYRQQSRLPLHDLDARPQPDARRSGWHRALFPFREYEPFGRRIRRPLAMAQPTNPDRSPGQILGFISSCGFALEQTAPALDAADSRIDPQRRTGATWTILMMSPKAVSTPPRLAVTAISIWVARCSGPMPVRPVEVMIAKIVP
jgi:hypothetical protein